MLSNKSPGIGRIYRGVRENMFGKNTKCDLWLRFFQTRDLLIYLLKFSSNTIVLFKDKLVYKNYSCSCIYQWRNINSEKSRKTFTNLI